MKKILFILIVFSFVGFSCTDEEQPKDVTDKEQQLPPSISSDGKVMIILDDKLFDTKIGTALKDIFNTPYPGLPDIGGAEPYFKSKLINIHEFDNKYNKSSNVLQIVVDNKYKEIETKQIRDLHAVPQLIHVIHAPNDTTLLSYLQENNKAILDVYETEEISRLSNHYKQFERTEKITMPLIESHQVGLVVPTGFSLDENREDFAWIEYENKDLMMGFFVYHYPASDSCFEYQALVDKRDSFLRLNVPGEPENSYMTTETDFFPPIMEEIEMNGKKVYKMRGKWRTEGDYMSGPYISLTTLDEKRNRVVTVEGFVYYPNHDKAKAPYLRQIEAIINSFYITEPE
jgi:hypothetical protein